VRHRFSSFFNFPVSDFPFLVSAFYLLVCLFASGLYRTVELGLFLPINYCPHSMESPHTPAIVRTRRARATNTGPAARAETQASPEPWAAATSLLFRSSFSRSMTRTKP